jgi:tetratricopeptide (TPR) repeat protein
MLSKGSVAVLPLILLGTAWWRRGAVGKSDVMRAAPFFAIAAVLTGVNIWFQSHDMEHAVRTVTPIERLLGAGAVVRFYLWKAFVPVKLAFIYPQWNIDTGDWRWWAPLAAAVAVTGVLWSQRGNAVGRAVLFAWACFCIALIPVMGFTDVGFMAWSLVADHYQHLALIAVAALVGAGLATWIQSLQWPQLIGPIGVTIAAIGALAALTYSQAELYGDGARLYRVALDQNPTCSQLYTNLGNIYQDRGRAAEAIDCYEHTLAIVPNNLAAIDSLGGALSKTGRYDEAMARFHEALEIKQDDWSAHNGMALALIKTGKPQESIEHFKAALAVNPNSAGLYRNLADAYLHLGKYQDAINAWEHSVELDPNRAEVHLLLSVVYAQVGQADKSRRAFERAVRLDPDLAGKYPSGPKPAAPLSN